MKILLDRPEFPCHCCQYFVDSEYTSIGKECVKIGRERCELLEIWDTDEYVEITGDEWEVIYNGYQQWREKHGFGKKKLFSRYLDELILLASGKRKRI